MVSLSRMQTLTLPAIATQEGGFRGGTIAGGAGEAAVELLEIHGSALCRDLFTPWRPAPFQVGRLFGWTFPGRFEF